MNTLGPKNIAKIFLSYIDPFDNCDPFEFLIVISKKDYYVLSVLFRLLVCKFLFMRVKYPRTKRTQKTMQKYYSLGQWSLVMTLVNAINKFNFIIGKELVITKHIHNYRLFP